MIDVAPLARLGLLLVRPGMLIMTAPAFGGTFAPSTVKIGLTLMLALGMLPVAPLPNVESSLAVSTIIARETMIGLSLGFGVRIVMTGAEFAGYLAGYQLGFAYASVVDPQAGARNTVLSSLYGLTALMVFFAIDGHHHFLRALGESYRAMPIGFGHVDASLGTLVARILGLVFTVGVQLSAPVVIVLLVVEIGLGLMGRAAPMLNLLSQGFPVRIIIGLLALAATVQVVPDVVTRVVPNALELAARLASAFR